MFVPHLCAQWVQDCLAYLLRLLSQFAVSQYAPKPEGATADDVFSADTQDTPRKKTKKHRAQEKLIVPRLNQVYNI